MADQHENPPVEPEASVPQPGDGPPPRAAEPEVPAVDEVPAEFDEPAVSAEEAVEAEQDAAGDDAVELPADEPVAEEPDWKDKYVRSVAELDNIRKRARRDVGLAEAKGIAKLAKELLPAIDDLERALAHAEAQEGDGEHPLTAGIRAVQGQLLAALARTGITTDSPMGEKFDPHRHEALTSQPVEGTEAGIVVQVFQPGYVYADTVLRAAKVVVSA